MITTGPMQLEKPEALDPMEPYFIGTMASGGYWTTLDRLSAHDHSGGLLGAPVAVSIPDGSITTADLDPSVLAPYALVDGSKPFTGQVTLQADAIVRDALYFGQQGTALAPDVTVTRTGAGALRVDTHLGVGVNPAAWLTTWPAIQVGREGALTAMSAGAFVMLGQNTRIDPDTNSKPITGGAAAARVTLSSGAVTVDTAPSVAAGAAQTFTTRAQIAPTGTLTLTPDAGQPALVPAGADSLIAGAGALLQLGTNGVRHVQLIPTTLRPTADNAMSCGDVGVPLRWSYLSSVAGTINTSAREAKEAITPLDPAAALAAVLNTDPVVFDYKPPERGPEWYELPDDPEQAEAVLHQRLTSAPLEAAARHQAGFVLADETGQYQTDPLFETGEGQSNAANSVGVILGAIHALSSRLDALEGAN
jgi:hypothetical protein